MNRCLLFLVFLLAMQPAWAQKALIFTNVSRNKMIVVREGQKLSLKYRGYMGQVEFVKNDVTAITDSTVILGFDPATFANGMFHKNIFLVKNYKVVRISDILAFRRLTPGRQILKAVVTTGVAVGSFFLLYDVYRHVNAGQGFLISLGVGVGAKLIPELLLPETPKYPLEEGWRITVAENK